MRETKENLSVKKSSWRLTKVNACPHPDINSCYQVFILDIIEAITRPTPTPINMHATNNRADI